MEGDQRRYVLDHTITFDDFAVELKTVDANKSEKLIGEGMQGTAHSGGHEAKHSQAGVLSWLCGAELQLSVAATRHRRMPMRLRTSPR